MEKSKTVYKIASIFEIITVILLIICLSLILMIEIAQAAELQQVESTAYCYGTTCADGTKPVAGLTVAGAPEWIGQTIIIYEDNDGQIGQMIGIYEVHDTGGQAVKSGEVLDIYMADQQTCINWGRRRVWIQLIDAEG